jgi:hypothetical protein
MAQKKIPETCPICYEKNAIDINSTQSGTLLTYKCLRCGEYNIDRVLVNLDKGPWYEVKHLVSAWVGRENRSGRIPNIALGASWNDVSSPEWWVKQFEFLGIPESTVERLDALLIAYGESVNGNYNGKVAPEEWAVSAIGAKNFGEIDGLTILLVQAGYLTDLGGTGFYKITLNGWLRIEELRKTINLSNSAFVAMWFADDTKLYRDSVVSAVSFCGYKPIIIDQQEYNDFIMNQVISSIKQSKFLVADFTSRPEVENDGKVKNGVRGGVYWEAGMAYGLGKPVIHTCEDNVDAIKRIHFDVNQYNTIFWKTEELGTDIRPIEQNNPNPNFAEKLAARILATVGKGTYIKD